MPYCQTNRANHRSALIIILLACCLAAPVSAYTIYLKDGSRILARQKYTVEGDRAIITLESGTETFLAFGEIDVQRTEEANLTDIGNALIFEDGKFVERTETETSAADRETVTDLIDRGAAAMRPAAPDLTAGAVARPPVSAMTEIELAQRQPLADSDLAAALAEAFSERGIEGAAIFQGTERSRPLVELIADSEASVFHGLEVAADVLLTVRLHHAGCNMMELLVRTADQQRAGEFALTLEMAESIRAQEVEMSAFFIRHVRF
jgi:hypothetical protein